MALDLARIRADVPAVERRAYLHNAGAGLMPQQVVDAMKVHLDLEAEIGGYAAADREAARLDGVYGSVARLINAAPDEIALMENATVAWQMVTQSKSENAHLVKLDT
jgi:selenocysteine lyase/cysteine desulfurase